ncbi:hypothetical protein ABPG75_012960 [Micractinium tetrahymenae]
MAGSALVRAAAAVREKLEAGVDASSFGAVAFDRAARELLTQSLPYLPPASQPLAEEHHRALSSLVGPLSGLAREPASSEVSFQGPALIPLTMASSAACAVLNFLLRFVESSSLHLPEADAMRLLAAGTLALHTLPRVLSDFLAHAAEGADCSALLAPMLACSCFTQQLLATAVWGEDSFLPPRVQQVGRTGMLRAGAVLDWMRQIAPAAATFVERFGPALLPADCTSALEQAVAHLPAQQHEQQEQLPLLVQSALVRLSAAVLSEAAASPPTPAVLGNHNWCSKLGCSLRLLRAHSLSGALLQHERSTGGGLLLLAGRSLRLLQSALEQLGSCSPEQDDLLLGHLSSLASLCGTEADAAALIHSAGPATPRQHAEAFLLRLNNARILRSLHRLLEVAAAAQPPATQPGHSAELARLLWQPRHAAMLGGVVQSWGMYALPNMLSLMRGAEAEGWGSSAVRAVAAASADTLLRLASLPPRLPAVAPSGAVVLPGDLEGRALGLSKSLSYSCHLQAFQLLANSARTPPEAPAAATPGSCADAERCAEAAFHAAMTACKFEWSGAAGFFASIALIRWPCVHPACTIALRACKAVLGRAGSLSAAQQAQRRMDCLAVCYLESLAATSAAGHSPAIASDLLWTLVAVCDIVPVPDPLLLSDGGRAARALAEAAVVLLGSKKEEDVEEGFLLPARAVAACPALLPALATDCTLIRCLSNPDWRQALALAERPRCANPRCASLAGASEAEALRGRRLCVEARDRRRRLLSLVLSAPQRVDRYLNASPLRRWMWAGISLCNGFYAGNIATLSFGALAVNDVFAAVVTLLFCEVVTHLYYTDTTGSLTLWYLNCFKIGLIAAMLADAAKLGS